MATPEPSDEPVLRVPGWVPSHRLTRRPAGRPSAAIEPDPVVPADPADPPVPEPRGGRRRRIGAVAAGGVLVVTMVGLVRLVDAGPTELTAQWLPGWPTAATEPRVPPGGSPMAFERTEAAFTPRPPATSAPPSAPASAAVNEATTSPASPAPPPFQPLMYEAESANRSGWATTRQVATASGGWIVGWIGARSFSYVRFTVTVPAAGAYPVVVSYLSDERRDFMISVNGGPYTVLNCSSTGGWTVVGETTVTLQLAAGTNTIQFTNPNAWAPDLDRITVTAPSP